MADEHLMDLTRKLYDEVMNSDNPGAVERYISPDYVNHQPLPPGIPQGIAGMRQFLHMIRSDFPNIHFDIQDMTVDGDKVWVRSALRGTSTGQFMGVPVTGRNVDTEVIDILRYKGDKLVEHWGVTDMATMMQQLGMSQPPGMQHP